MLPFIISSYDGVLSSLADGFASANGSVLPFIASCITGGMKSDAGVSFVSGISVTFIAPPHTLQNFCSPSADMPQDEHTDLFDIENPPNKTNDSIISDFMSFEKYFCEIFRGNLK